MGSLVLTQAPEYGPSSYHQHMMVDADAPYNGRNEPQHPPSQARDIPAATTPQHNAATRHDSPASHSRPSAVSTPSNTTETSTRSTSNPPPGSQPYHPHNYNAGYDQSGFPLTSQPSGLAQASPASPRLQPTHPSVRSLAGSEATSPSRIKVRDLSHIQSFASEEYLSRPRLGRNPSMFSESGRQYEISSMPVTDIIEMVAGLLTKITTTNDRQHEHIHRPIPPPEEQGNMNAQTQCVLAFHGKNVPSITILSYLSRIHKYCPTTYEVFLSLLVYFDRMTEMVNRGFLRTLEKQDVRSPSTTTGSATPTTRSSEPSRIESARRASDVSTPPSSGSVPPVDQIAQPRLPPSPPGGPNDMSQFFVVDSFNIHRLVIAGVTCASKFFSDVFYTNSRYAKVSFGPDPQ